LDIPANFIDCKFEKGDGPYTKLVVFFFAKLSKEQTGSSRSNIPIVS